VYDGREHFCPQGPHILHLFSFSKAWGMMGWRQGYIAFPSAGSGDELATPNDSGSSNSLGMQLLKVQDTVPICAPQLSQQVSLAALEEGREWVLERVANLAGSRDALLDALSPLGKEKQAVSEGAIYLWTRLPDGCDDDVAVVTWLVQKHRVCLIPGSSCGSPGHVRVAFANLEYEKCLEAAARLKTGLQELLERGMAGVNADLQTRL
jgi:aromatic aminotransferase